MAFLGGSQRLAFSGRLRNHSPNGPKAEVQRARRDGSHPGGYIIPFPIPHSPLPYPRMIGITTPTSPARWIKVSVAR